MSEIETQKTTIKYILPEKYIDKFLEQYNLCIQNPQITKPVIKLEDLPKAFAIMYLNGDKLQAKFNEVIDKLKCETVQGIQVIRPFSQLSKSLSIKLTNEFKEKFIEAIQTYQPHKRDEIPADKQEDFKLQVKFNNQIDLELQQHLKKLQINKYMMQIYNKIKKDYAQQLTKCNRDQAQLEKTFAEIIEKMTPAKETITKNSKTQKEYTRITKSCIQKYKELFEDTPQENVFDIQNKFSGIYKKYTDENKLQKQYKVADIKMLGAQILNNMLQECDAKLTTQYLVKKSEVDLKQYTLKHNKQIKEINQALQTTAPDTSEYKQLNSQKEELQKKLADKKVQTQQDILRELYNNKGLNIIQVQCNVELVNKKPRATKTTTTQEQQ